MPREAAKLRPRRSARRGRAVAVVPARRRREARHERRRPAISAQPGGPRGELSTEVPQRCRLHEGRRRRWRRRSTAIGLQYTKGRRSAAALTTSGATLAVIAATPSEPENSGRTPRASRAVHEERRLDRLPRPDAGRTDRLQQDRRRRAHDPAVPPRARHAAGEEKPAHVRVDAQ